MDLFSEVGLDMKVDISSLATQSQSTAPTSIKVIASPANPSSPNFQPQQVAQMAQMARMSLEKNAEGEETKNGWDDDDIDIWSVCNKQSIGEYTMNTGEFAGSKW